MLDAGYGSADREEGIVNNPQTKFCVASIGKLFTAAAIAQLAEQRKLSFGNPIGKFLTGFAPSVAGHVTIAELLDMTSGLGDEALATGNPPATLAGMMKLILREHLQSSPGSRFLYSNDGYIVLGAVACRTRARSCGVSTSRSRPGPRACVGGVAERAGVRELILSHYLPAGPDALTDAERAERAGPGFSGRTTAGRDGLRRTLPRPGLPGIA